MKVKRDRGGKLRMQQYKMNKICIKTHRHKSGG